MSTIDPILLAVLNGRLVQIADEMDATLYRSAFNPIIAEAHDACHGLYHAQTGATLVQGTAGLPIFVGAMAFAVKAVIDKADRDADLAPGDTYLFNDPYDGGTHLNDFKPGAATVPQRQAVLPGSPRSAIGMTSAATCREITMPRRPKAFRKAVRVPPVKLARKGVIQQDIIDILGANITRAAVELGRPSRTARCAGSRRAAFPALLEEYGDGTDRCRRSTS